MILAIIGVLLFGRRLPEVGRALGQTIVQLRRGLNDFKTQMNADEDFREAKSAMHEIRQATEAPRVLANPRRWFEDATDESRSTPMPAAPPADPPAGDSTDGAPGKTAEQS